MQNILNWIRSLLILYFLMMILLYFTAGSSYQKLIRFFMGIVMILTMAAPVLRLFGGEQTLLDQIGAKSVHQYLQELSGSSLNLEETASQKTYYEQVLAQQFLADAAKKGFGIREVEVSLSDACEPQLVIIREETAGDGNRFRDYLIQVYGLEGQVLVE